MIRVQQTVKFNQWYFLNKLHGKTIKNIDKIKIFNSQI